MTVFRIMLIVALICALIGLGAILGLAGQLPAEVTASVTAALPFAKTSTPPVPLAAIDFGQTMLVLLCGGVLLAAWLIRVYTAR